MYIESRKRPSLFWLTAAVAQSGGSMLASFHCWHALSMIFLLAMLAGWAALFKVRRGVPKQ